MSRKARAAQDEQLQLVNILSRYDFLMSMSMKVRSHEQWKALEHVVLMLDPERWDAEERYEQWLVNVAKLARWMNAPNPDGVVWRLEFGPGSVRMDVVEENYAEPK